MRGRRDSQHPRTAAWRSGLLHGVQEEVGEQEVAQVVQPKVLLKSIPGSPLRDHHYSSWNKGGFRES